jgi:hypothetical protein
MKVEISIKDGKSTPMKTKGSVKKIGTPVKTDNSISSKSQNKVLIIGDSQARGCASNLTSILTKTFKVTGTIMPGLRLNNITSVAHQEINCLCRNIFLVIWGDTNDISKNESDVSLRYMRNLALHSKHTNIIAITPSHRYDLPDFSCVNKGTQVFIRKVRKSLKAMQHVNIVDVELSRDSFTQHGFHLNSSGKEWISKTIAQTITTFASMEKPIISLNWKEAHMAVPTVEPMTELARKSDKCEHGFTVRSSSRTKRPPINRHENFLWVTCPTKTV